MNRSGLAYGAVFMVLLSTFGGVFHARLTLVMAQGLAAVTFAILALGAPGARR